MLRGTWVHGRAAAAAAAAAVAAVATAVNAWGQRYRRPHAYEIRDFEDKARDFEVRGDFENKGDFEDAARDFEKEGDFELDRDFEDAVGAPGSDAVCVGRLGQREAAIESAADALEAFDAFRLIVLLGLAFACHCQDTVFHADVDVFASDARDIGPQDKAVFLFNDINGRGPVGDGGFEVVSAQTAAAKAVKIALDEVSK